jgi:CubicO group peptidase (beta-lactamase class C family)
MKSSLFAICCSLLLAAASLPGETAPQLSPAADPAGLTARFDAIVNAAVADGFAGGVAVVHGEDLVYERTAGFSDAARRVPVTDSTLFHVASITKYFTACLTLRAAREGLLDLDGSIDRWVGGTGLAGRGLTFHSLLAHRSGLGSSYAAERKGDPLAASSAIARAPWSADDAGEFHYSNDGYDLLAILLEKIYGRPYEALVREKLLVPGLALSPKPGPLDPVGFWGETDLTDPRRVGQPLRRVSRGLRKRNYGMIGSSGLLITARGLARFEQALGAGRVLDSVSLEALRAPRGSMSLGQATFGAFLVDHPSLGRVLTARGYEDWGDNAILNHYLDRETIVAVVTSKGPPEGQGEPFRNRLAAAIEAVLEGEPD